MGIDVWRLRVRSNTSAAISSAGEANEVQTRAAEQQGSVDDGDLINVSPNESGRADSVQVLAEKASSSPEAADAVPAAAGTASAASGEDEAFSASTWTLSARPDSLGLTLIKSPSSTDPCCSAARVCTSLASPAELIAALVLDRTRRRHTSMPMASSRMLCKFCLFDMPFEAPSAHAAFFRFLSVFFRASYLAFF